MSKIKPNWKTEMIEFVNNLKYEKSLKEELIKDIEKAKSLDDFHLRMKAKKIIRNSREIRRNIIQVSSEKSDRNKNRIDRPAKRFYVDVQQRCM